MPELFNEYMQYHGTVGLRLACFIRGAQVTDGIHASLDGKGKIRALHVQGLSDGCTAADDETT